MERATQKPAEPPRQLQRLIDRLPADVVKAAARTLLDHCPHGPFRVQLPNTWCSCGADLGPALHIKAGEQWLHQVLDEVEAARGR